MSRLTWDTVGERYYETGVDHGVLYPMDTEGNYPAGEAWNGLSSVSETPSGADPTAIYADNIKYLNIMATESFGGTIEAYTYPKSFAECDGTAELSTGVYAGQQSRRVFGLSYRTKKGNDVESNEFGYKLHLVYGALASPSQRQYSSINESPEAINFSWTFNTTPVAVNKEINGKEIKPLSLITIDSVEAGPDKMKKIEDILYGTDSNPARLPLPAEIVDILAAG